MKRHELKCIFKHLFNLIEQNINQYSTKSCTDHNKFQFSSKLLLCKKPLLYHLLDSTLDASMGTATGSVQNFVHLHRSLEWTDSCTFNNLPSQHPGQRPPPELPLLPAPLVLTLTSPEALSSILLVKECWRNQISKSSFF